MPPDAPRPRFFAPLPERGVWSALDLTRSQFFWILAVSVLLFFFVGGALGAHAHESHLWRLAVSYAVIPPAVAWALHQNGKLAWLRWLVGTAALSLIKLVLTALLLVVVGIAA
jgi:hypothetical protein